MEVARMSEYCKNCKQLQERVDELNGAVEEWLEEEESWKRLEAGLLARVEELEKERDAAEAELWGANYFTEEMIDLAWGEANQWGKQTDRIVARRALRKFRIYQCGRCGGSGAYCDEDGCNGHGWVIRKEKDDE